MVKCITSHEVLKWVQKVYLGPYLKVLLCNQHKLNMQQSKHRHLSDLVS